MEDARSSSSARIFGLVGAIMCSSNGNPEKRVISQPRNDQDE